MLLQETPYRTYCGFSPYLHCLSPISRSSPPYCMSSLNPFTALSDSVHVELFIPFQVAPAGVTRLRNDFSQGVFTSFHKRVLAGWPCSISQRRSKARPVTISCSVISSETGSVSLT